MESEVTESKVDKVVKPAAVQEEEEDVDCGAPGSGAVVDMEVFGQLLEIVSALSSLLSIASVHFRGAGGQGVT